MINIKRNMCDEFHELYPHANIQAWEKFAYSIGLRIMSYRVTEPFGHKLEAITLADMNAGLKWTILLKG